MGGIGKTTLARKLYNEFSSNKHFDLCLWATVSQEYDQLDVLLSLLGLKSDKSNEELKVDLHKKLWSRRYLIVLDDVWSSKVWDDIRTCAPDNSNRSRIILTTRGNDVADYVSSRRYEMQLLNKEDSWKLFRKIVHDGEKFPDELEEIAHIIVRKCGGLPLALQVIGGFMSRAERIKDLWENVANDISAFIRKEDDQFSGIFSWSYANLPHYLKPCLLYMGAFPEDHAIQASRLIKLWVAEGFLNPIQDKSPEEVAEIYLNALIDRNLIIVRERKFSGRVKSYGMHDLLRDLCLRKAEEKKFILLKKLGATRDASCIFRVCVSFYEHIGHSSSFMELMTRARSFRAIGYGADECIFPSAGFELSSLRVLDLYTIRFHQFPEDIFKLVNLNYLALSSKSDCKSPLSIALLGNLQTIIFDIPGGRNFVMGISHLQQLRHLKSSYITNLQQGSIGVVRTRFTVGETLQSLAYVTVAAVTQLLGKLPNLKSLGIEGCDWYQTEPNNIDLASFPRLETIKIKSNNFLAPIFPQTLRELTIMRAENLSGTFMRRIGGLPNLQLLRLGWCDFESGKWEPSEGEFCSLQYLRLFHSNLENWMADETHYPQLKHLNIFDCKYLKEIPLEIGGIETLEIIQVDNCKACVFDSARSILQEQCDFGNDNLHLHLECELSDDDDEDREEVEVDHDDEDAAIFT